MVAMVTSLNRVAKEVVARQLRERGMQRYYTFRALSGAIQKRRMGISINIY